MALHGQDMEFVAQRSEIMAGISIKPWLEKSSHGSSSRHSMLAQAMPDDQH
jgi:hypothetical protein